MVAMKTNVKFLALAVVATALAFSCVKEEIAEENINDNQDKTEVEITGQVFEAVMENTKSTLVDKTPTWAEEDVIALFGNGSESAVQLTYAGENKFQTEAGVTVEGPYYAIYPYDENHTVDQTTGIFTATVPAEQTIAQGQNVAAGALASVAYSEDTQLYFRNAVSLIRIENKREDIVSIKIESTNAEQMLAGTFTMDLNPDKEAEGEEPEVAMTEGTAAVITLKPEGETFPAGELYAAVLPKNLDGIKVTFERKGETKNETATVTKSATVELKRNGGANLGSFFTYEIKNAQELLAWNKACAKWTDWDVVTLTDNIDCKDVINSENWTPNVFTGTFDGKDKTIDNFVIELAGPTAFFNTMKDNAVVKNLTFGEGCSVTTTLPSSTQDYPDSYRVYAAMVSIYLTGNATLQGVINKGSVNTAETATGAPQGNYIGGLVGTVNTKATIVGCENHGAITFSSVPSSWMNCGGLFGEITSSATLQNCKNYGKVQFTGTNSSNKSINLGGISGGVNTASFVGCTNLGSVESNATEKHSGGTNIGGIVGINNAGLIGTITDCVNGSSTDNTLGALTNNCAVGGELRMGGFIGYIQEKNSNITSFKNYGPIANNGTSTSSIGIGGVVGIVYGSTEKPVTNTISSCENYGTVTNAGAATTAYVGGIAGWLKTASTNFDKVSNAAVITNSSKNTENTAVGGIVGYAAGGNGNVIKNAENKAKVHNSPSNNVKGITSAVGGIVGIIENGITTIGDDTKDGVKNSGEVTSGQYYDMGIGGIVAKILGTDASNNNVIKNCLNTGKVYRDGWSGDKNVTGDGLGGVLGFYYSTVASNVTIVGCTNNGLIAKTGGTTSNMHIGGIAGAMYGVSVSALISECTNANTVNYDTGTEQGNNKYAYTGGIVGYFQPKSEIRLCTNSGTVVSKIHTSAGHNAETLAPKDGYLVRIGGIVGDFNGTKLTSCVNTGTVKDESTSNAGRVGGIAGGINTAATLFDCDNKGPVSCCFDSESRTSGTAYKRHEVHMGGIAGYMASNTTLEKCDNSGSVTNYCKKNTYGKTKIGGFAGLCYAISFKECTNTGTITNSTTDTKEPYVAGFVGQIESEVTTSITDCSYNANVIPGVSTYTLSGILVGRLTDKIVNGDKKCTTTVSGVTVKGKFNNIDLTAENYGTYTFGTGSDYGKKSGHETTGITFAE